VSQQLTIVLSLLLCAGVVTFLLDARQRRIDRHLAVALPTPDEASLPRSIRRAPPESSWVFLHRLANYRPGAAGPLRPEFVLLAGGLAAAGVIYANDFVGFSTLYASLAAVVAAVFVVRGLFGWQQRRLANQLFRQLPDTLQMVTSAVRSGVPVNEAFRTIAREMAQPTAGQFAVVCNEMSLGRPGEEALDGVYRRSGVTEYAMFAVTIAVQTQSGGRLTETLQTLADTVRERVVLSGRAKALAADPIFSARALSIAPFVVFGLLSKLNPDTVDLLFTDPIGKKLLAYALGSVLVGIVVIRWMVRRDTSL
jgi:tight adherence protein B